MMEAGKRLKVKGKRGMENSFWFTFVFSLLPFTFNLSPFPFNLSPAVQ